MKRHPVQTACLVYGSIAGALNAALRLHGTTDKRSAARDAAWSVLGASLACCFSLQGRWSWGLPIILRHRGAVRPTVYLTFDDGPSLHTPRILELLAAADAQASFFVLTDQCVEYGETLLRTAQSGHTVGFHGHRHEAMTFISPWQIGSVVRQCRSVRSTLFSGERCAEIRLFRPPYGFKSVWLPFALRRHGLQMTNWSLDSRDYALQDAEAIATRVVSKARSGDIILLHDGAANDLTVQALPRIIASLQDKGFAFAALPDHL